MNTLLKDLFNYNDEANKRFIKSIEEEEVIHPDIVRLMSHIFNAHEVWVARIEGHSPTFGVWQLHSIHDFARINEHNYTNTQRILSQEGVLEQVIRYENSKGEVFENLARDILMHVINHSTYHRAQVASMLKKEGIMPPNSDYIFYKREQE
ncbi:DinB family protein [Limibacter armeniacum]|uniref:DinB family protein n=1 Tax=Limibacter armeniacum TaxID=466084 RepID=UPI002FE68C28